MSTLNYKKIAISEKQAARLAADFYQLTVTAKKLPGDSDFNFQLTTKTGAQFILKVSRPGADVDNLALQTAVLSHLNQQNNIFTFPQLIPSIHNKKVEVMTDENGHQRALRLMTWQPGRLWANVNPHSNILLENLGQSVGLLMQKMQNFEHPAAQRFFDWNSSELPWIKEHFELFQEDKKKKIVQHFYHLFEEIAQPKFSKLRRSVIHGDLNDYNILVAKNLKNPSVKSFIDFGDVHFSHTINELAVTCAYAMMGKKDPLSTAAQIVKGCHQIFPLQEEELEVLYVLIAARLLTSVTHSTRSILEEPENEYRQISARPSWGLLEKLQKIHPQFAHYTFRAACKMTPNPKQKLFKEWVQSQQDPFFPVVKFAFESATSFDLSVGSTDLGHSDNYEKDVLFDRKVKELLWKNQATVGIGGYGETRPVYTTDAYLVEGNNGPKWRTVHLGLDIWTAADTPIFAPLDGKVMACVNNAIDRDYGPTIVLEHNVSKELTFYTLYGHLSLSTLSLLKPGQAVKKGQRIGAIGAAPHNGNWPPHLHFQVILDQFDWKTNYPGVAFPDEKEVWLSNCPDSTLLFPELKSVLKPKIVQSTSTILTKRQQIFPQNLSVSYQKPLQMLRGARHYLFDETGRRYLDTINNVPHVGHQHPRVVQAAKQQYELLNTNTRYLHPKIMEFGEALLATFPPELCVVSFVNSGSEANELALRMAKTFTKRQNILALKVGYHGNTNACVEVSSYKFDGKGGHGAPPQTHIVPMPDAYRGQFKTGDEYAKTVEQKIMDLQEKGVEIAGMIAESILSCGGQIVPPKGYFQKAFQAIRKMGGVCIMDEVQVGFGRLGETFWGFELHGVVPDIVTLGKPIGNGHPLGAVVCTRAIADAFANGMEYFSTFGGNPVSVAIGQEVLQIVQEEKLQQHALETGNYLLKKLRELQQRFPIIGDVRGHGLFLGFELVKNQKTLEPAAEEANYLINRMRELGVLMSTDGPLHNVIKIKPPMTFGIQEVDFLVEKLEVVFEEDFLH